MATNLEIDENLFEEALSLCEHSTADRLIEAALRDKQKRQTR